MKFKKSILALATVSVLAACSDDSDTASSGGANVGSRDTTGLSFSFNQTPPSVSQEEKFTLNQSNAVEFARVALNRTFGYAFNGNVNSRTLELQEAVFEINANTIEEPCQGGGTVVFGKTDVNGNFRIDAGDAFSATFNECNNSEGTISFDFSTYNGTFGSGSVMTDHFATADNFVGSNPADPQTFASADGVEARRITVGSGRYQYVSNTIGTSIKEQESMFGSAESLVDASFETSGSLVGPELLPIRVNYKEKGDFSTRLDIPATAAYTVVSDGVNVNVPDNVVATGDLKIESGGIINVRALGTDGQGYLVRIGIDENSDGSEEKSCVFSYDGVRNGTADLTSNCNEVPPPPPPVMPPADDNPFAAIPVLGSVLGQVLGALTGLAP